MWELKMSNSKSAAFVVLGLMLTNLNFAMAGNESGHGGGTWVCRDTATDAIRWVKLVDLFEAKSEYGLTLDSFSTQPIDTQLSKVADKIKTANADIFSIYAEDLKNLRATLLISENIDISHIPDAHFKVTPAKDLCPGGKIDYEQVANFPDGQNLVIAALLYSRLSLAEQAALLVHEAVYKMYRDEIDLDNSDLAREAVGYLFSTTPVQNYPAKFFGLPEDTIIRQVTKTSWRIDPPTQTTFDILSFFLKFGYTENFWEEIAGLNDWHREDGTLDNGAIKLLVSEDPDLGSLGLKLIANWTDLRTHAVVSLNLTYGCMALGSELTLLKSDETEVSNETEVHCYLSNKSITGAQQDTIGYGGETIHYVEKEYMWLMFTINPTGAPENLYLNHDPIYNPSAGGEFQNKFVPILR